MKIAVEGRSWEEEGGKSIVKVKASDRMTVHRSSGKGHPEPSDEFCISVSPPLPSAVGIG